MCRYKSGCVVVPAYNEETQISKVIETMPGFVDKLVIVDDASNDRAVEIVRKYQEGNDRILLIEHEKNQGVGGAIADGCIWARDNDFDMAAVMAGDGQMNPDDLPALLDPVVEDRADYSKGNRLFTGEAYKKIPKIRYYGNAFLSLMTKVASGYWHVADFQSGYTVINRKALHTIDWNSMYRRFGQPNDLLVRLNVYNFRVADIPIEPVYNIGEKFRMSIFKVMFTISWLLLRMFFWRMKEKYIIRDFHPLIFFYALGVFFSFMSASLFTLFAMWFDMEANKDLKGK